MAEPFKNIFSPEMVRGMSRHLARVSDLFDPGMFESHALQGLEGLELMQRSDQFSRAIDRAMSANFEQTVEALLAALHPDTGAEISQMRLDDRGVAGFAVMPFASYVARHGLAQPEYSLNALREMTKRFSSEFAVRVFFRDHPDLTLRIAQDWATDDNEHVRRLASEGSRPRLPWGIRLQGLVKDPAPVLPILEILRDDPSDYVRRSVANNLNDIAKDHPDLVANIAVDWLKSASKDRQKLVKHACRSLIKAGHPGALAAFGYGPPDLADCQVSIGSDTVRLGDNLDISLTVTAIGGPQKLLVDYVLHFMRANGKLSAKVFKWTELTLAKGESRSLKKTHPYRQVTTRRDYPGRQKVTVQINGVDIGGAAFEFIV